jgi:uncharacterized protein (TIGR03083 family)
MDVWEMAHGERLQIAEQLEALPEEAWTEPTLCEGWTVADVVGHMTAIGTMSTGRFVKGMLGNRLNFGAFQAEGIAAVTKDKSPAKILEAFRATAESRAKPPGPKTTVLGEVLVHGEDIFRPRRTGFGQHPVENVVTVADFYKRNGFPLKVKRRIAGVTLRMTDGDWSFGSGPEVAGLGISILMAMVGRKIALSDLQGEGVAVLSGRS